ncbi:MAG: glycosyltransferase [Pyrinomonadaceae bacterium]
MTVSLAMIVRDEERTLGRCLASVAGAFDEIVVVDTGSRDSTKEVALRHGARVFDFEWVDDFAAARQFAFDRATSDWVVWLDADDVVTDAARVREAAASAPPDVAGFEWRYVSARDAWGNALCEFWRERCVRNDGTFRWRGRVHEVLVPSEPRTLARDHSVVVEHRPEAARASEKTGRNLRILEAERRAAGPAADARVLFYLGNEYAQAGRTGRAIACYRRYLRAAIWDDERYYAQTRLASLLRAAGRFDESIEANLGSLRVCPHWPAAYFGLAETYYHLRDWHKVVHWCEVGRAMPRPDTPLFVNPLDQSFNWIIFYTNALYHLGETEEALRWTRRALELRPDDAWHRENFLLFAGAPQSIEVGPAEAAARV